VDEVVHAQMPDLPGLMTPSRSRTGKDGLAEGSKGKDGRDREKQNRTRSRGGVVGEMEVRGWMGDVSMLEKPPPLFIWGFGCSRGSLTPDHVPAEL
jgi:hypothetical protein